MNTLKNYKTLLKETKGGGGGWEGGSAWGTHVRPWLIYANAWQEPPQYCKVINLQLK